MNEVIGPIGFCDFDKEGMLVEGFDEMGMYITLYNHPYYAQHMAALGYSKEVDWIEFQIKIAGRNERVAQMARVVGHCLKLHTKSVKNKKEIKPYLRPVFELVNEAYKPLFGTVPLTDRQIDFYVKQFLPLIDIRLILNRKVQTQWGDYETRQHKRRRCFVKRIDGPFQH